SYDDHKKLVTASLTQSLIAIGAEDSRITVTGSVGPPRSSYLTGTNQPSLKHVYNNSAKWVRHNLTVNMLPNVDKKWVSEYTEQKDKICNSKREPVIETIYYDIYKEPLTENSYAVWLNSNNNTTMCDSR